MSGWAAGPVQHSQLARQLCGMPALDAGLGDSLEESLKTLVPEALDHSHDRIARLYSMQWGCHRAPEFQTLAQGYASVLIVPGETAVKAEIRAFCRRDAEPPD
jgi:hypothetical protein